MKDNSPLVSVVMAVYNAEKYLAEAVESILQQTLKDFEFIIVDDGSTDSSLSIINKYRSVDNRIKIISRENKGLPASLNEGVRAAKGKYIARMDADDISVPNRFEVQIAFMREKLLSICGSYVTLYNGKEEIGEWTYPVEDAQIKFMLIFQSSFAHPSVMFEKNVFYLTEYSQLQTAQDYKLWCDLSLRNYRMGNVPRSLLLYRFHENQVSKKNNWLQRKNSLKISENYVSKLKGKELLCHTLKKLQLDVTVEDLDLVFKLILQESKKNSLDDDKTISILRHMIKILPEQSMASFFCYIRNAKQLNRDVKSDFYLLFISLLKINRESRVYQVLKRFIW